MKIRQILTQYTYKKAPLRKKSMKILALWTFERTRSRSADVCMSLSTVLTRKSKHQRGCEEIATWKTFFFVPWSFSLSRFSHIFRVVNFGNLVCVACGMRSKFLRSIRVKRERTFFPTMFEWKSQKEKWNPAKILNIPHVSVKWYEQRSKQIGLWEWRSRTEQKHCELFGTRASFDLGPTQKLFLLTKFSVFQLVLHEIQIHSRLRLMSMNVYTPSNARPPSINFSHPIRFPKSNAIILLCFSCSKKQHNCKVR